MNRRIARGTVLVCIGLAVVAGLVWPGDGRVAAGVLGGGLLMGLAAWAIRGAVDGLLGGGGRPSSSGAVLVKIFTRHAILGLAAYGMMMRLHLDPVGMLVGVSAVVIAAGVEAVRRVHQVS